MAVFVFCAVLCIAELSCREMLGLSPTAGMMSQQLAPLEDAAL